MIWLLATRGGVLLLLTASAVSLGCSRIDTPVSNTHAGDMRWARVALYAAVGFPRDVLDLPFSAVDWCLWEGEGGEYLEGKAWAASLGEYAYRVSEGYEWWGLPWWDTGLADAGIIVAAWGAWKLAIRPAEAALLRYPCDNRLWTFGGWSYPKAREETVRARFFPNYRGMVQRERSVRKRDAGEWAEGPMAEGK